MFDKGCKLMYFFVHVLTYFFYLLFKNLSKVDVLYSTLTQFISVISITGGFLLRTSAVYSDSVLTGSSRWAPVNAIGDGRDVASDMLLDSGAAITLTDEENARKMGIVWVKTYGATQALLPNNTVIPEIGQGMYRGLIIHIFDKIHKGIASLSEFLFEGSGRRAVYTERNAWVEERDGTIILVCYRSVVDKRGT